MMKAPTTRDPIGYLKGQEDQNGFSKTSEDITLQYHNTSIQNQKAILIHKYICTFLLICGLWVAQVQQLHQLSHAPQHKD